ncbi:META domain-containing protein [Amnibacterium sp. CER49]|uniref:META domain-containing protein n=1 Tax=Amnibacterium sp. CER49 TaxID=3039161 RepID=UPI00244B4529|nr:META domain-containing protein [Amnibacterium sp. CER49]MDH2442639.1 META domain-containing protein [Amnibacterium sp. CER49]
MRILLSRLGAAAAASLALTLAGCAGTSGAAAPMTAPASTATPTPASATGPTCHPAEILPFECGTYRSVWGAKPVVGDAGGPAKDPLTFSVDAARSGLVVHAVGAHCFTATQPVRLEGKRLVPIGRGTYGRGGCAGEGANTKDWAYAFLRGPHRIDASTGGLAFDLGAAMVTFDHEGVAPLGSTPVARNDRACVPAHVRPFSCGTYRSVSGSGTLTFLAAHPYRLSFEHINGGLTAELMGRCNALGAAVEPDGDELVVVGVGSTLMGCTGAPGAEDAAFFRILTGALRFQVSGSRLTVTKGASSAVFRRG